MQPMKILTASRMRFEINTLSLQHPQYLHEEQVLERNMARMAAETALQSQEFKKQLNERRAARGAPPMEQAQAERDGKGHPLVRLIEERGWDDFGFMLMRMDYSDDARFDQFRERFSAILDKSIESRNPSEGFERVVDKLFTKIVDDDIMNNTGPVGTSRSDAYSHLPA